MTAVVRTDKMERPGDKWSIIGEVGHRDALHFKYHEGKSKTRDSSRSFFRTFYLVCTGQVLQLPILKGQTDEKLNFFRDAHYVFKIA